MFFGGRRKRPGEVPYGGQNTIRNHGVRIAKVTEVPPLTSDFAGTVEVMFLDGPGGRKNVIATQSQPLAYVPPRKGDYILVGFSADSQQCFMVGYVPYTLSSRHGNLDPGIPPMLGGNPGEVMQQGPAGQMVAFTNDGNATVGHGMGGETKYNLKNQTVETRDMNLSWTTEAGTMFFGLVKRFGIGFNIGGFASYLNKLGLVMNKNIIEPALTEFVLKVNGLSNVDLNSTTKDETMVVEVRAGNIVTDGFSSLIKNVRAQINVYSPDNSKDPKCSVKMLDNGEIFIQGEHINFVGKGSYGTDKILPNGNAFVTYNEFAKVVDDIEDVIKNHKHAGVKLGAETTAIPVLGSSIKQGLVINCKSKLVGTV